jgi:predicted transcriptional regulator
VISVLFLILFLFLFRFFSPNSITNNNRKNNINKHTLPTNRQNIRRLTTAALPSIRILMKRTARTTRKGSTITRTLMLMINTSIIPMKKNLILRIRAARPPGTTITSIVLTPVESFLQEEILPIPIVTAIPARSYLVYKRRTTTRY